MANITEKEKLILGAAGAAGQKDAITVDIDPAHKPDVLHDLNAAPWPFKDDSFKEVICHHVLEHLSDLPKAMKELHRITRKNGMIYIETPHFSSCHAHAPEHKLMFNYFAFDSYLAGSDYCWQKHDFKFKLLRREITFHRAFRRYLLHRLWNRIPKTYERFWTFIIPAEHIKLEIQPIKD